MHRPKSLAVLSVISALSLVSCREKPRPPREFSGQTAFGYIQTQVGYGPRIPGTEAHQRERQWLDSLLQRRADTVLVQDWKHVTGKGDSLALTNFLARFNPKA